MPMYEYACRACGQRFELFRAISERDLPAVCPQCGAERTHVRVPAAVFGQLGGDRAAGGAGARCGSGHGPGFR